MKLCIVLCLLMAQFIVARHVIAEYDGKEFNFPGDTVISDTAHVEFYDDGEGNYYNGQGNSQAMTQPRDVGTYFYGVLEGANAISCSVSNNGTNIFCQWSGYPSGWDLTCGGWYFKGQNATFATLAGRKHATLTEGSTLREIGAVTKNKAVRVVNYSASASGRETAKLVMDPVASSLLAASRGAHR